MDESPPENRPEGKELRPGAQYGPFLTLGMQLAIAVVVFFFLGRWLDDLYNTAPWCTLVGAGLRITGGMIKFIKSAQELGKRVDEEIKEMHRSERHEG